MQISLAYKMKNGLTYTTQPFSASEYHASPGADFLQIAINGKLNNSTLEFDGKTYTYEDLASVEILFSK